MGLHWIDGIIIAIYAMGMIGLGWYYSRRQQSTEEYFTGSGRMNPLLIGISLFATLLSTITYLSSPGEIIKNGPVILTGALSIPIGFFVVGYGLIPVLMRHRVTRAYELLEQKLGLTARLVGAGMFITLRLMWMAVLLNFAANAMLVILGWEERWLFAVTVVIGSVALIYSSLGGLRAVVITDLAQFVLLFGGALTVILMVSIRMRGFDWFPTKWDPSWKRQPIFSDDPHVRLTVVGVIVMQSLWTICTAGGDQTAIQRFMATKNASIARRAYLINALASFTVMVVLALVGLSLMGYFRAFPQELQLGRVISKDADKLFPDFIGNQLPIGVAGLVVSGMFAAAMSSIDSGVNSISAVVLRDFVDRFRRVKTSPKAHVKWAQLIALSVGALVIGGSTLIEEVPGNLLVVSKRVTGLLVTPIFTLFFLALFVRFATSIGASLGAIAGFLTAIAVSFWKPLFDDRAVSITWINPLALTVGITVGCLVSLAFPKASNRDSVKL